MPTAKLTYTKTFSVDLTDEGIRGLISQALMSNGVDGAASADDVHDALLEMLNTDPDTLIPSLDETFDSSNFTIEVEPSITEAAHEFVVGTEPDEGSE